MYIPDAKAAKRAMKQQDLQFVLCTYVYGFTTYINVLKNSYIPEGQAAKRAMKQQDLQSYFELDLLSLVEQVLYS